jgi:hypothetical protein
LSLPALAVAREGQTEQVQTRRPLDETINSETHQTTTLMLADFWGKADMTYCSKASAADQSGHHYLATASSPVRWDWMGWGMLLSPAISLATEFRNVCSSWSSDVSPCSPSIETEVDRAMEDLIRSALFSI